MNELWIINNRGFYLLFEIGFEPDLRDRGIMMSKIIDMLDFIKRQLPGL